MLNIAIENLVHLYVFIAFLRYSQFVLAAMSHWIRVYECHCVSDVCPCW